MKSKSEHDFEDILGDEGGGVIETAEVPLDTRPFFYMGVAALAAAFVIGGRIFTLGAVDGASYEARAAANIEHDTATPAPRALILDRFGSTIAGNSPTYLVLLNAKEFVSRPELQSETVGAAQKILGIAPADFWQMLESQPPDQSGSPLLLSDSPTDAELIALKSLNLPTFGIESGFTRDYQDAEAMAPVVGYVGYPTAADLKSSPGLRTDDMVGKEGVEAFYDSRLRGTPGVSVERRDARGRVVDSPGASAPRMAPPLTLNIDAGLQSYFYDRMTQALAQLGRHVGVGIALDPRNGEILALVGAPSFDPNAMSGPGHNDEKLAALSSPYEPLFNRAIAGAYNPGSTIKPLVGVAALAENVIDPSRKIFSPGYLDIPNPYDPTKHTRALDWQYQGWVNLASAIAQSSDVYFYEVGGGTPPGGDETGQTFPGLGISRLEDWWRKFNLGSKTGIDLPGEGGGFLPSPSWKEQNDGRPWLLGDTYNVSIGQGDLLLTPIQLINYIATVASKGKMYVPEIVHQDSPRLLADLTSLAPEFGEVEKGMLEASQAPNGSAYMLHVLPYVVAAKTGSAQIENNTQENAFFVGYGPAGASSTPQIAVLVLIEHSKEGSPNAIPIAKDVFQWYWDHRLAPGKSPAAAGGAAYATSTPAAN